MSCYRVACLRIPIQVLMSRVFKIVCLSTINNLIIFIASMELKACPQNVSFILFWHPSSSKMHP